jgi:hypothetical protein
VKAVKERAWTLLKRLREARVPVNARA